MVINRGKLLQTAVHSLQLFDRSMDQVSVSFRYTSTNMIDVGDGKIIVALFFVLVLGLAKRSRVIMRECRTGDRSQSAHIKGKIPQNYEIWFNDLLCKSTKELKFISKNSLLFK